ncbi:uncharacterized protein LOC130796123 isoform X2 [Actinidia eriantha]|uniref:uncharacterized protein LOC130796123 isoform X2 n=1 Tax=Actinidia eriantha TaxID=165200 RepID=UPI00258B0DB9|nr:uncharacterized protein LOC130796123 isoform X2 [Actinidia eriantha]
MFLANLFSHQLSKHGQAQQKMHCDLQRTCSSTQKISDCENSVSSKSLEGNNCRPSSNEREVSSLAWRNSDHRRPVLTFYALEPNGHWRIVALPLQCPDDTIHLRSGSQVKMDGLHLVSPSLVSSVKVDQQKGRRGPSIERSSSIKSFTSRRISGSKCQYQSRNKGLPNKVSRWNALPGNSSCQTSFSRSDSSVMISTGSNASNSSDTHNVISKVDKAMKRNLKKKARKKGNRNKKLSCDTDSTGLGYVRGSSTSETGAGKKTDYGIGPLPYATRLANLSPESIGNGNDSEENSCSNSSETVKVCTSYVDEVDVLEANLVGEYPLSNTENGVQTVFPEFSIVNGVQDTHSKPIQCSNDPCSSGLSETNDSSVLDSTSVCSNGNESINAGYSVKKSTKGTCGMNVSEPPGYIARKGCSHGNILNGIEDSYCQVDGTTSSEQRCNRVDMSRRGKQIRRMSRNSSVSRLSTVGKFSGRSGKENSHSIWQKVQKNDGDECSSELRKVNLANSQSGAWLKEVPLLKKKCNVAQSSVLSSCEDKNQAKPKASRKLKRKTSPGSKQDLNSYSSKGPYATKASSNVCAKIDMLQNEVSDIPAQDGGQKALNRVSGSCSQTSCRRIGLHTNRVQSITSEPVRILEGRPNEVEPLERVSANVFDYEDQEGLLEGRSTEYLNILGGEGTTINKAISPVDHSKPEHSCEAILQKWIPVGIKDYELARSGNSNSSLLANRNKPAGESCALENTVSEMADPDNSASSTNASIMCSARGSIDDNALRSEDEVQIEKHSSQSMCTSNGSQIRHVAAKCLNHDSKDQNNAAVENDSNKIAKAVNDAYRAQLASEAVQLATGCPIAEFERLLSSASPVISLPHNFLSCLNCLPNAAVDAPFCRHKTPNVSLGSLWQWYEKHGTYGLEVRAEDYGNSKRLGIDRVAFRAYFVPFLSAVQLFRNCKTPSDGSSKTPSTEAIEAMEACKCHKKPQNSSISGHLQIFPVLLPQSRIEDTSSLSPKKCVCCPVMSSVCIKGNETLQSGDSASSDDLELLFEYFEVEQPQQRRPLFEVTKELVRGDGPSQCRTYGDPTKLDSVALNDLHHKSWYSVAWYPIYRIPDDNFRAAFLTYHSLGHLVRRSVTSDSFGAGACVVSPVVGLQSYNAQGECWFQLRQSALSHTTKRPNSNPSGILKERLRTLEQTASLMARAVVTKGNLSSVNRQPDYEFFLSRRRR